MKVAILHYSVAPVVGGVESVIQAHTRLLLEAGYPVRVIAGAGESDALPTGAEFIRIPEMDSQDPRILKASRELQSGRIPEDFGHLSSALQQSLLPALDGVDALFVHNVFTKHFNLPLTAALASLLDQRKIASCIAWCHDFTWTSPHSRPLVHPGFPWDLLRTYREDVSYVTVSRHRQDELAGLFRCPLGHIQVIYDGVDMAEVYGLSMQGRQLVGRLGLEAADLILLMPVRITQAKNIELALEVVADLKNRGVRPKLVISGPPDPHDPQELQYYRHLLDLRRELRVEQEARFVYESGPQPGEGYTIELDIVMELYRVCDALFLPSHREGFGMPILEAGLAGMPIFSTAIPAALEVGGQDVMLFKADDPPAQVAQVLLAWWEASPTQRLRRRVRQTYTWQAIFQNDILPLLKPGRAA